MHSGALATWPAPTDTSGIVEAALELSTEARRLAEAADSAYNLAAAATLRRASARSR